MESSPLVFLCASQEDASWLDSIKKHLSILEQKSLLRVWDEREVKAGLNREEEWNRAFSKATIVVLLVSVDLFIEYNTQVERAMVLQRERHVHVLPVLVSAVSLKSTPLEGYQVLPRNGTPLKIWQDPDRAFQEIAEAVLQIIADQKQNTHLPESGSSYQEQESLAKVQALSQDVSGILQDRLASFIGRTRETVEIRQRIAALQITGGYLTITGQAGQGKSSVIARLVGDIGPEQTAYHFVPLDPGPDHQIELLRHLMARIILKYQLPTFYIASSDRSALCGFFPRLLQDVHGRGGKEIIFIDGLDQLEEEANGRRDLSFLPPEPPPGIVFALGIRPNDTLELLLTRRPQQEYRLPLFSRVDFGQLLIQRQTFLKSIIADRLYTAMEGNALFLDLAARELSEFQMTASNVASLIAHITNNPSYLFTLAIRRLKKSELWERVIYPTLGLLLAAREPLSQQQLVTILQVDDYHCRDGLMKLVHCG